MTYAPPRTGSTSLGTGTRATRIIGALVLIMFGWTVAFGLGFSPADRDQGESVRLLYLHAPTAWVAYLSFAVTAVCSGLYLFTKKHSLGFDRFAGASGEVGTVFMGLALFTGAMWGRLSWGVYWAWDARLTTTAMLFITYVGYLSVRNLGGTHQDRARRSAIIGLLAVVEIPLVHFSVVLWRSLHQDPSVFDEGGGDNLPALMEFSLFVAIIAFTLLYVWLVLHRSRSMALADMIDDTGLDRALRERRAEGES